MGLVVKVVEIFEPSLQLASSYLAFIEDLRAHGDKVWDSMVPREHESALDFVARLKWEESNHGPSMVPQSTYWGVISDENGDGMVIGRIVLRHHLNEKLRELGGHVSYEVRPAFRRRGLAKAMLQRILETPRAQQIGRLLLTCAPHNEASNKTITANGGVLEKTAHVASWNRDTNYYWIDLRKRSVPT